MNQKKLFLGIFLTTLSILMLELSLTRLFSATMYYHFAFMAISLALFGSAASGVFIYVFQSRFKREDLGRWLSIFAMLFGVSVVIALIVILQNPLTFGNAKENILRVGLIYVFTVLPFFFGGCVVTLAITHLAADMSRLYLFDLAGGALGCLLLIPALNSLGAINVVIMLGSVASIAAILFSLTDGTSRKFTIAASILAVCFAGLAFYNNATGVLDIRSSKGREEADILFSKWNSFSRITVNRNPNKTLEIKIDSDASTTILPDLTNTGKHQDLRNEIQSLAYNLKPGANAAIIGPGGGRDVAAALVFDANKVTAIELNPIIARDVMLNEPFSSFSGDIYRHPKVDLVVDEGRSFIRRSTDRFDVLQASMVDTWAATAAGAFSLSENNLYTVEAFKEYAEHLTDDGVFTMTRWYFEPPTEVLRLFSISRAMMDELKIGNPERHFIMVRSRADLRGASMATFLFKKSEFTDDEVKKIEAVSTQNGFEILYSPLTQPDNSITKIIKAEDPASVWRSFETNIYPTYDNNPFFFHSVRLASVAGVVNSNWVWRTTNLGTLVLVSLLVITTVMVALFVLLPLFFVKNRVSTGEKTGQIPYLFYFACLGAGFIIVEIAMIQKFILFLGHPVYALAVILFSLLAFSSIGSALSGRFEIAGLRRSLVKVIFALVGLTVLYILILAPIFYGLVGIPLAARIVIAVVLIAPLGLLMGMPMPMGIKILSQNVPQIIPWAWGVNGATSVMGTTAALSIAVFTGFNQALVAGAMIYLVAAFCIATTAVSGENEELA